MVPKRRVRSKPLSVSWSPGFLQNSKSDSKSIASKDIVQADRRPEAVVSSPNNQQEPSPLTKIKIPCVPNDFGEFVQFPAIGDLPAARGEPINTTVVKLPFHGTPYTISLLYPGAKDAIEAVPGFPSPYMPSLQVHYRIGDVPGAGKDMFALADLEVGDVILRERPLCLVPLCIGNGTVTVQQVQLTTLSMVVSMEPQDRKDFSELTICKPGPAGNPILGIISTNALDASRIPGDYNGQYVGICRDLCRVNHRSVVTY